MNRELLIYISMINGSQERARGGQPALYTVYTPPAASRNNRILYTAFFLCLLFTPDQLNIFPLTSPTVFLLSPCQLSFSFLLSPCQLSFSFLLANCLSPFFLPTVFLLSLCQLHFSFLLANCLSPFSFPTVFLLSSYQLSFSLQTVFLQLLFSE